MKEKLLKALSYLNIGRFLPAKDWHEQADTHIKSVGYAHHVPHRDSIPEDLQDKEGSFILTDNGYSVAGRMLPEEVSIGSSSPALPIIIGFYSVVYVIGGLLNVMGLAKVALMLNALYFAAFYIFFGFWGTVFMLAGTVGATTAIAMITSLPLVGQMVGGFTNTILATVAYSPAVAPLVYLFFVKKKRASMLAAMDESFGGSINAPKTAQNKARFEQAEAAELDQTKFVQQGIATGSLSINGDEFAPDKDLPFGQTVGDLSTHLLTFGKTGAGKTSLLRQIFLEIIEGEQSSGQPMGVAVFDGKANLPDDFRKYLDIVIDEKLPRFNFIDGMLPEDVANALKQSFAKSEGEDGSIWNLEAYSYIFNSMVFRNAMVEVGTAKRRLSELLRIVDLMIEPATPIDVKAGEQPKSSHPLLEAVVSHPDFMKPSSLLSDAVRYFMTLTNKPVETKGSIYTNARAWITPFFQSSYLRHWADSDESDFNLEDVCYGKKIGFSLPESKFQATGPAITSLMKTKLFRMISNRPSNWKDEIFGQTSVTVFVDEAQMVMNEWDKTMLPIARSLGMIGVYATQNIDNIYSRFGAEDGNAILEAFSSVICLKSSHATHSYMADRIGKARIISQNTKAATIGFKGTAKNIANSAIFDPNNSERTWLRKYSRKLYSRMGVADKAKKLFVGTTNNNIAIVSAGKEEVPILQAHHIQMLNEKFMAIAVVERAGTVRRDLIRTIPLDSNFNPIRREATPIGFVETDSQDEGAQYEEILFKEAA